jgi:hypothetical protein
MLLPARLSSEKMIEISYLKLDFQAHVWMGATSNRELARQLEVSETAVRRAERARRIKREADGSWDPAKVKAAWSDNTDQAQQRPARGGGPGLKRRVLRPVSKAALGAVRETLREHGEPVTAGTLTFMQARTANEVLKAQERQVRLQRMKAELVDREPRPWHRCSGSPATSAMPGSGGRRGSRP